jgi:murein DD-endopeptidase MepM/ murein hydrolase activator NlpD
MIVLPLSQFFGRRMGSKFGRRTHPVFGHAHNHNGQDISAPRGTPIRASAAGVVRKSWHGARGGNQILVDYPGIGFTFGYAHLDRRLVSQGQRVAAGTTIGTVGNTGVSTGPHLHFTVRRIGGVPIEPLAVLRGLAAQAAPVAAGGAVAVLGALAVLAGGVYAVRRLRE